VRDKYKTKNIIRNDKVVFLRITNQTSAKTISRRNFRPMDTRLCIVWLSASFVCPRMKILTVAREIRENPESRIIISYSEIFISASEINRYPARKRRRFSNKRKRRYFRKGFKKKSFNKVLNNSVNSGEYTQKGKDYGKYRSFVAREFIKLDTSPGCKQYNSEHLECYTRILREII
jgi:hypothetical protein